MVIRAKRATDMLPTLEAVLGGFGAHPVKKRPTGTLHPLRAQLKSE
jgi:hypothetical protein